MALSLFLSCILSLRPVCFSTYHSLSKACLNRCCCPLSDTMIGVSTSQRESAGLLLWTGKCKVEIIFKGGFPHFFSLSQSEPALQPWGRSPSGRQISAGGDVRAGRVSRSGLSLTRHAIRLDDSYSNQYIICLVY